jgi:hypothetical protein
MADSAHGLDLVQELLQHPETNGLRFCATPGKDRPACGLGRNGESIVLSEAMVSPIHGERGAHQHQDLPHPWLDCMPYTPSFPWLQ